MPKHRLALAPLALALILAAATGPALASHYRFTQIELVSASEQRALAVAGIYDTRELLHWTASRQRRGWLAETTGLDYARLGALATECDLLRIDGVGPTIAEALQKAGVIETGDLARAAAAPLLDQLRVATRGTAMRSRLPDEDTLATWIASARRLRPLLEDIPRP